MDKYVIQVVMKRIPISKKYILRQESEELFLIKAAERPNIFSITSLVAFILVQIDGKNSLADIAQIISLNYDGESMDNIRADLCCTYQDLKIMGVVG